MKHNTLLGLALVFGSIGGTYALVSADTFDRDYDTYNTISRNTEKAEPIRFGSGGYFIRNPQTQTQQAYNTFIKAIYEDKTLPEGLLYPTLDKCKETILQGDEAFADHIDNLVEAGIQLGRFGK